MRIPASLFLVALLAACRGGDLPGWSGSVGDSAGVTIVRNPVAPVWAPEEAWWVEEELRVGGDQGVPETLFGFVADVAVDPEGRLFVLDQQARAVRVFDARGSYLRTLGGPGEGPGELGQLVTSVVVRGDEIWVPDWVQARVSRYRADGTILPSFPVPHAPGARSWWEEGGDGAVWLRTLLRTTRDDGTWGGEDHLLRLGDALTADTVLSFDYSHTELGARGAPRLPPVVNAPAWAVLPDGTVAWTTLDAAEIRMISRDGRERRIRSGSWLTHPPTAAEETALVQLAGERLEMLGGSARTVEQVPVDFPAVLPVLTDLHAGPGSTLWAQRAGPVRDVHPMALNTPDPPRGWGGSAWEVLDREGRSLGTVELPPRFRVMAVGDRTVVGVQSDALRVDQVLVLKLHRPGGEG